MTIKTDWVIPFRQCGSVEKQQHLFQVAPGVDLADALIEASNLLDMVYDPIHAAGMGDAPLQDNPAWLVLHAIESAKAVIDSLAETATSQRLAAEQAAKKEVGHV